ncbi:hypothetical protein J22TS1_09200 [Siminovitchia terrae]|uniref:hypothetical protein n=1 Tax=Siminovitchia terrae TaxID=1914933 RepID=UPI001B27B26C|nr:hypothetical protein [Siminovitchia terrae]GIN89869.1 hypothetical protein J22TS1_09200 [Siminovitchia terrae]
MSKIDKIVYNAVIASMLVIIFTLIFFIFTNNFSFKPIHDSILSFVGTLGGAFLGAWLAGKYAIRAANITINENKLWNYEEFRRLLIIHKRNLYYIYNHSNLIAKGELGDDDLDLTSRDISYHYSVIYENIDLGSVPADYYKEIKMITILAKNLKDYAFLKNKTLNDIKL